ncbi:MAG: tetratricopeptide repeat protein [Cyanobacteriota/Melainabacteria group bacterium]
MSRPIIEPIFLLGKIEHRQGEVEKALENYRKALVLQPHSAEAAFDMGVASYDQKDFQGGEREFREGWFDRSNPSIWRNLALALLEELRRRERG